MATFMYSLTSALSLIIAMSHFFCEKWQNFTNIGSRPLKIIIHLPNFLFMSFIGLANCKVPVRFIRGNTDGRLFGTLFPQSEDFIQSSTGGGIFRLILT